MTYRITATRPAQQDSTQSTVGGRQYSSGTMSVTAPPTGEAGSPLTPYFGLKKKPAAEKPLGRPFQPMEERQF